MGIFDQLASIVEWDEFNDEMIFWKWSNKELKKSSRLIIKPGQDAIFLYNGRIEGIFKDEGNFEIESDIIPFLSTLKGFKFGFKSGLRAEVLFVNTKEITVKWGTKTPINIPSNKLPGGIPIRGFGTFSIKVDDYLVLIDKIAGVKQRYEVSDVKERVLSNLDQLLMRWIIKEGKDMFNLQANAIEIAKGIKTDLDMELIKIGLTITDFAIASFNYPEEIQKMIEKNASYDMVGDVDKYQKIGMVDAYTQSQTKGNNSEMGQAMTTGMGMAAGLNIMNQMFNNMNSQQSTPTQQQQSNPNQTICNKCNATINKSVKFCPECGEKLESISKFCGECGTKLESNIKFCPECGAKNI